MRAAREADELALQSEHARLQAAERVAAVHAAREEVHHSASADARVAILARERERAERAARQTAEKLAEAEAEALELSLQRERADQVALASSFALDIPWVSGVALCQAKGVADRPAGASRSTADRIIPVRAVVMSVGPLGRTPSG